MPPLNSCQLAKMILLSNFCENMYILNVPLFNGHHLCHKKRVKFSRSSFTTPNLLFTEYEKRKTLTNMLIDQTIYVKI